MLKKIAGAPYVFWAILFILIPIIMVGYFSLVSQDDAGNLVFSLDNYVRFFEPIYLKVLGRSIKLALEATIICLLIGYPMAMILSRMNPKVRTTAVMLFVVPMWMNFLLRTYAWMTILGKNGILNKLMSLLHLPQVSLLYSEAAVLIGMVYNFLPFMVLPIYTVLSKMDNSLIEAAQDLGANQVRIFRKVIFPLSISGVISGISMVFMPAVSTFVISDLLYGGQYMLVGNLIQQQFLTTHDWYFGSAISMFLMVLILITMSVMNRVGDGDIGEGSVNLW